ncbi:ATP-binding protein [Paucibacter sp. AS339]|uniref:ATP-binding protein n=1 Tax=Paucibacter hankyongi TaxID=3133434 RepID=UPI0030B2AFE9
MKLLPRIAVSVILPMLALASVTLVLGGHLMRDSLLLEQNGRAQAVLAQNAEHLRQGLDDARDTLRVLASSEPLVTGSSEQRRAALQRWNGMSKRFEAFYYLDTEQRLLAVGRPAMPAQTEALWDEVAHGREGSSAPFVNEDSGELVLSLASPVFDLRGRQVGVLIGNLKLEQLLSFAVGNATQEEAKLMVLDGQGRLIAGGLGEDSEALSAPSAASQPQTLAILSALRQAPKTTGQSGLLHIQTTHQAWYAEAGAATELDWRIVYAVPELSLFARAERLRERGMLALAACALLALLGAALLRRIVLRPLEELGQAHARLQSGDHQARAAVLGNDEISALAQSFNQMAETLAATDQRFRLTVEAFPYPITLARLSDGAYVDVNPAFSAVLGVPRHEAVGRTPLDFGLVPSLAEMRAMGRELLETGKLPPVQVQAHDASGQPVWMIYTSRLLTLDKEQLVLAVATDITALKQVEIQLRQSEQSLMALFESAPLPMARTPMHTGGDSPTYWNQAWYQAFGYEPGSCDGKPGKAFDFWVDNEARRLFVGELIAHDMAISREALLRRADGSVRLCEVSGRYLNIHGERVVLTSYLDVTDRKRVAAQLNEMNSQLEARVTERTAQLERRNQELDEALQILQHAQTELVRSEKLASLGSLVAGIAHELNTPIGNAMLMATTLAARQKDFEAAMVQGLRRSSLQDFLAALHEASRVLEASLGRAAELISSFKQVAVDQSSYQLREFDLKEVLHETALSLGPSLRRSGVSLREDVPEGQRMNSYPGPLIQVFMNIVNNAMLHAFEPGKPGLIEIKAQALNHERVLIELSDDGQGMPSEHLTRAFDPFFTTKLGQGGSGLGLHIVYNLVTGLLGGQISIISSPGQGTRVSIELPLQAPLMETLPDNTSA